MTARRRANSLATFLCSMAVLTGLPVLLSVVAGWPLPRQWPRWSEVGQALADGWRPEGTTLLHCVAILAWVAWAQLAANTLLEVAAQLRNRPGSAVALPLSGWCRPFAVRFAATVVTLIGTIGPRPLPAVALPVRAVVATPIAVADIVPPENTTTVVTSAEPIEGSPPAPPIAVIVADPPADVELTVAVAESVQMVRPGDSLWRLAERHLGDPLRWRELWQLNHGRLQPDGRRLGDADLLRPGWRLAIPATPTSADASASPTRSASVVTKTASGTPAPVVLPTNAAGPAGDPSSELRSPDRSESELATRTPDSAQPSEELPAASSPAPSGSASASASGTSPGVASTPQFSAPSGSDGDGCSATASPTGAAPAEGEPASNGISARDGSQSSPAHRPSGRFPFNTGVPYLVAGAVVGYLAALLTLRERWRRPGHRFPRPSPELTDVERRVRAVADPEAPTMIDLALRHLAAALSAAPEPSVPGVLAVRCGPSGVEVLLDKPVVSAPGQFHVADDGHSWRLDPRTTGDELAALAGDQPPPFPALVSVGTTSDGPVLIDLGAVGSLGLAGDPDRVMATFQSIALELATTPWAASVDVVLVGGDDRLAALERVRVVDPAGALDAVRSSPRPDGDRAVGLAAAIDVGLVCPTVVLVSADAVSSDELGALLERATPGSGLVVVVAGSSSTRSVLSLGSDTARLEPPGFDLEALPDPVVTDALVTLVADAASPGGDVPEADATPDPVSSPARPVRPADPTSADDEDPADEAVPRPLLWVRVLGPVTVDWRHTASRPQLTELLAFIATHPPRIGADRVRLALWPVDPDDERFGERSPSTLWTLVSKARLALGTDPDGGDLLITQPGNVYELCPQVGCDWVRFETLRKMAADEPERTVPLLRQALGLVRGRPFQDIPVGSYSWVGLDRLDSDMSASIAEAAGTLVAAALAADDVATARFAVEQGRLGTPHSETLIRAAMRVCAAAGDREGLDRALRDARRLAQLLDPTGEPEPETVALHEELRHS